MRLVKLNKQEGTPPSRDLLNYFRLSSFEYLKVQAANTKDYD